MKIENKRYFLIARYVFIVGACLILFCFAIFNLGVIWSVCTSILHVLSPFIYGFVFAYLLKPVINWLEKRIFVFSVRQPKLDDEKVRESLLSLLEREKKKEKTVERVNSKLKGFSDLKKLEISRAKQGRKVMGKEFACLLAILLDEESVEEAASGKDNSGDSCEGRSAGMNSAKENSAKTKEAAFDRAMELHRKSIMKAKIKKRRNLGRALSIITAYVLFAVIISSFVYVVIPQIVASIGTLIQYIPPFVEKSKEWLQWVESQGVAQEILKTDVTNIIPVIEKFSSGMASLAEGAGPWIYERAIDITSGVTNSLLGIIISVYMLYNKEVFAAQGKKLLLAFLAKEKAVKTLQVSKMIDVSFGGFISARVLDSVVVGVLCFIGMEIMGAPYVVLISVIIGITNIIPYIGPFIGGIPAALMILMVDPFLALIFVIFLVVLQQVDGNVISVLLVGNRTGISAFWVMFSVLVGGGLFGLLGMFIGVPFFAVFYALGGQTINSRLVKRGYTVNVEDYMVQVEEQCE